MLDQLPTQVVRRFSASLDALAPPGESIGLGVSGGADSLALLLLAAKARPGKVEAATVDHGLREGSRAEADQVAALCATLGVPHEILTLDWDRKPETAIQEQARVRRYGALADWAKRRELKVLATAHHANDQAETLVMRLARGAGVNGLAGMRPVVKTPGSDEALVRPLLGWPRRQLERICKLAEVEPAADPSNDDEKFERVRVRKALAGVPWYRPLQIARSAMYLADADRALAWAANREWDRAVGDADGTITLDPAGLPREIRRRLVLRAIGTLASEGGGGPVRGRQLDRLMVALNAGRKGTLRGVVFTGGSSWTFAKAPPRAAKATAA